MTHSEYMKRALRLAARGRTSPNPMVGAVIVKGDRIVGDGYHPQAGEPHAEIFALKQAGDEASGATMYVTLEPCCHFGRTPPCCEAVIEAGIAEVYAAMADPDPKVSGGGFSRLQQAGVKVHYPLLEDEARHLNEAYIKHRTTGMPFVILKSAMSLDGRIATRTGDSKWITNDRSRAFAHGIRSRVDVILIGGNTARTDDPALSARIGKRVIYPRRVIVSSSGDLPETLKVFSEPGETIIATSKSANVSTLRKLESLGARILQVGERNERPSIREVMARLGEMGCLSVLIEGGGEIAASALEEGVVDKAIFFYAPKIIGGRNAVPSVGGIGAECVSDAIPLERIKVRRFGDDVAIEGYIAAR